MSEFVYLLDSYPITHSDLLEKDGLKRKTNINSNKLSHLLTDGIGCYLRALKSPEIVCKPNLAHVPNGVKVKRGNEIFTMNNDNQLIRKL